MSALVKVDLADGWSVYFDGERLTGAGVEVPAEKAEHLLARGVATLPVESKRRSRAT